VPEKGFDVLLQAMRQPLLYLGAGMVVLGSVTKVAGYDIAVRDSVWPILVGLGICLLVGAVTLVFLERKPSGKIDVSALGIKITFPRSRDLVRLPQDVAGTYEQWPDEPTKLWLFSLRGGAFRPLEELRRGEGQNWSASFMTFNVPSGQPVKMGVFAVGLDGQAQIDTYRRTTEIIRRLNPNEEWPGMRIVGPDTVLCAVLEVIIRL